MKEKIQTAVNSAKKYLREYPQDPAHDLAHHERVWGNCQLIVENEGVSVDKDLLQVACFWHDVSLGGGWAKDNVEKVSDHLPKYLTSVGFSEEETNIVVLTVRHHEFLDTPETVECMVLQDADKLDIPSMDRVRSAHRIYKKGEMNEHDIKSYFTTGLKWLPILSSTMYFKTSEDLIDKLINEVINSEELQEVAQELGIMDKFLMAVELMTSEDTNKERKKQRERVKKVKQSLIK